MPMTDSWTATNIRLWQAIRSRTLPRELLVSGPAGTGKTYGILDAIHVLCRDNVGLRVLMARATRVALTESVLVTYEQEILPRDGLEWIASGASRRGRQVYTYPSGSQIVLGGLDDARRVLSTTWDLVYINEAIEATEEVWETILTRMSRPGRDRRLGYLIADTNPGDPSHWLKKRVDAGVLADWPTPHQANPAMFDGHKWTEAGLYYLDSLDKSLSGTRRQRLLLGLWAAGEGVWFPAFDPKGHVSVDAEYDPSYPVYLACDNNGLHTGGVWFQVRETPRGPWVTPFGDYYNDSGETDAYHKAIEIKEYGYKLCGGRADFGTHDPAAGARTGLNTTISAEYARAGLNLAPWPSYAGSVLSGLNLIESFVGPSLTVHPRCERLITALANYKRAKRAGQWVDQPEDPQHPHEDLIDALRGGLLAKYPEGRRPEPRLIRVPARRAI